MSILLNFLLIPVFGVSGAAIAVLLTQIFTNIVMSAFIKPLRETNKLMLNGLLPHKVIENAKYLIQK